MYSWTITCPLDPDRNKLCAEILDSASSKESVPSNEMWRPTSIEMSRTIPSEAQLNFQTLLFLEDCIVKNLSLTPHNHCCSMRVTYAGQLAMMV